MGKTDPGFHDHTTWDEQHPSKSCPDSGVMITSVLDSRPIMPQSVIVKRRHFNRISGQNLSFV